MTAEKVPCTKCGAAILKVTADNNNGLCMSCSGKGGKSKRMSGEDVAESIGCGVQIFICSVCGFVIAGAVYAPISKSHPGIAIFAAIGGFVVGCILGLLAPYIRMFFQSLVD